WFTWSDSLGQDQLVLRRQSQAVVLCAMRDDDLALHREQLAAVDTVAAYGDGTRGGSRTRRMRRWVSAVASRGCSHLIREAPIEVFQSISERVCTGRPDRNPTAAIYNRYKVGRPVVD